MDQLFSNKLNEQNFEVPEAFLADLNSKLDAMAPVKKKAFPWFWSSLVVAILGGSFLTYWLWSSSMVNVDSNSSDIVQHDFESTHNKREILLDSMLKNTENKAQNKDSLTRFDSEANITLQLTNSNSNVSKTYDSSTKSNNSANPTVKNYSTKDINTSKTDIETSLKSYLENEKNLITLSTGNKNHKDDTPKQVDIKNTTPSVDLVDQNNISTMPLDSSKNNTNLLSTAEDSKPDCSLVTLPNVVDTTLSNPLNSVEEAVPNLSVNKRFELQVNAGVALVKTTLKTTNTNYLAAIVDSEQRLITPDFGVTFNYWMNKISLGVGAHYFQTGENVNYQTYQYNTYDSLVTVTYDSIYFDTLFNNNDTITITVSQMVTFTDTLSEYYNGVNNYQWLSIPLSFGYRFDLNKWAIIPKLSLNIEIGLRNTKGTYLTTDLSQFTEFNAVKFGLSYALQCELRREINDWHIFLSPYYRSNFKPTIIGDNWERSYQNYGINFGVGFKF
jgi:hypothetical protein